MILYTSLQSRLSAQGSDGIAVMEAVNSLPSDPNFRRNDFSHLGIQAPTRQQQQDMGQGAMAMGSWVSLTFFIWVATQRGVLK